MAASGYEEMGEPLIALETLKKDSESFKKAIDSYRADEEEAGQLEIIKRKYNDFVWLRPMVKIDGGGSIYNNYHYEYRKLLVAMTQDYKLFYSKHFKDKHLASFVRDLGPMSDRLMEFSVCTNNLCRGVMSGGFADTGVSIQGFTLELEELSAGLASKVEEIEAALYGSFYRDILNDTFASLERHVQPLENLVKNLNALRDSLYGYKGTGDDMSADDMNYVLYKKALAAFEVACKEKRKRFSLFKGDSHIHIHIQCLVGALTKLDVTVATAASELQGQSFSDFKEAISSCLDQAKERVRPQIEAAAAEAAAEAAAARAEAAAARAEAAAAAEELRRRCKERFGSSADAVEFSQTATAVAATTARAVAIAEEAAACIAGGGVYGSFGYALLPVGDDGKEGQGQGGRAPFCKGKGKGKGSLGQPLLASCDQGH